MKHSRRSQQAAQHTQYSQNCCLPSESAQIVYYERIGTDRNAQHKEKQENSERSGFVYFLQQSHTPKQITETDSGKHYTDN